MAVNANVTQQTTHLIVQDQDLDVLSGNLKRNKHGNAEDMQDAGYPIRTIEEKELLLM